MLRQVAAPLSCEPLDFVIVSIIFNNNFFFFLIFRIWVVVFMVDFPLIPLHWPALLLSLEVSFSSSLRPEIS